MQKNLFWRHVNNFEDVLIQYLKKKEEKYNTWKKKKIYSIWHVNNFEDVLIQYLKKKKKKKKEKYNAWKKKRKFTRYGISSKFFFSSIILFSLFFRIKINFVL